MRFFPCSNPMKTAAVRSSKILNSRSRESLNYHANKYSALKPQESIQFFKQSPIPPGSSKFLKNVSHTTSNIRQKLPQFCWSFAEGYIQNIPPNLTSEANDTPLWPERGDYHASEDSSKCSAFSLSIVSAQ